jgi:hypothetical protein
VFASCSFEAYTSEDGAVDVRPAAATTTTTVTKLVVSKRVVHGSVCRPRPCGDDGSAMNQSIAPRRGAAREAFPIRIAR